MLALFLVVDEVVPADKLQFRVRKWRQAGFPPLVLFSQIPDGVPPEFCSCFLANFTLRNFLGYRLPVPVFFEVNNWGTEPKAFRLRFETIGCIFRPILPNPKYTSLKPSAFEQFFGATLDALMKGAARR